MKGSRKAGLLLNILLSPIIFILFFTLYVENRYFTSALIIFLPFIILVAVEALRIKFHVFGFDWRNYLIFVCIPISFLFLLFAMSNYSFLLKYYTILIILYLIAAAALKWKNVLRLQSIFVWFSVLQIILCLLLFATMPRTRFFNFETAFEVSEIDLASISSQSGISAVVQVFPEKYNRKLFYPGGYSERDRERFDPYMIQCTPDNALLVSYENRSMVEKVYLSGVNPKRRTCNMPITYFFCGEGNWQTCYMGSSFVPYRESSIYQINWNADTTPVKGSLYYNLFDSSSNITGGFRMGYQRQDLLHVLCWDCKFLNLSMDMMPESGVQLPNSHLPCSYLHYQPDLECAYVNNILSFHRVDAGTGDVLSSTHVPFNVWSVTHVERKEVAANGFGSIVIMDAFTLEKKRKISTPAGIRSFAIDPVRNLIVVGQYFTGRLSVYDYLSGELLGTRYVGTLVRAVQYCPYTDKIYAGSSAGIFQMDLDIFRSRNEDHFSHPAKEVN